MFDAKEGLKELTRSQPQAGTGTASGDLSIALNRGKLVTTDAAKRAAPASRAPGQAQRRLQGGRTGEYGGKAKDILDQTSIGTVAILGSVAALLLGTEGGRVMTGNVIRVGAFAAIGGIAYKAFRNYQEGKPLMQGVPGLEQLTAAPEKSGFSEHAHTNESALLLIRTMVATAAADGVVDPSQRARIVGELRESGLHPEAAHFLDAEIQHPATVAEIEQAVGSSKDLALEVYASAHFIAATAPEMAFLDDLAKALALDPGLVAYVNATSAPLLPAA